MAYLVTVCRVLITTLYEIPLLYGVPKNKHMMSKISQSIKNSGNIGTMKQKVVAIRSRNFHVKLQAVLPTSD